MASLGNQFLPNDILKLSKPNVVFKGKNYRITVLSDRLVRLEYSTDGVFIDAPTMQVKNRNFDVPVFKLEQNDKYLVITTNYFSLQYTKEKPFLGPKFAPESNLKVKLLNSDKTWYYSHPEVRNFKFGAFSLDDFKGSVDLVNGLYSVDGFATLDDSKTQTVNERGLLVKESDNRIDLYLFMYKRDFGLCLKDYFTLTGYPALIPRYALGIWWNRDTIYSFNDVNNLIKSFRRQQIPLSVLLLSEFWHIKDPLDYNLYKSGYSFNPSLFPIPDSFIKLVHDNGVKIGVNIDPTEGVRKEELCYPKFSSEYNVSDGKTIPFNTLDKTFMMLYISEIINPLLNMNIDVFWIDYKKDLESLQIINYYQNNNLNGIKKRIVNMSRNPIINPHLTTVLYSGETLVGWDTLKYLPFYNSIACNKGVSFVSHDVGGFKDGIEDSELYTRYVEFATFSPIFRFSAKRGVYYKRAPWMWDAKTYTITREYCWLRHRLIPYIYSEAYNYHKNGLPLIQPVYYAYPEVYDEPLYKNEYYFGRTFFVCPITKPMDKLMKRSIQKVFLPKGVWYEFKSGKKFEGNLRHTIFYKEEDYPVFVQSGAIIPLANLGENKNDTSNPVSMEFNIFPGASNKYQLYEDDGVTNDYLNNNYHITAIDYNYLKNNYTLIIHSEGGNLDLIPKIRDYKIRFRNTRMADKVEIFLNSEQLNNPFRYYEEDKDFVIDLVGIDTSKQVTINCKGTDMEINSSHIINEDINSVISDLKIPTSLKEEIGKIMFSADKKSKKRIAIKKIKKLDKRFRKMFIKLLEYVSEL